jgi:beta-N-acetylhexosaminidase
MGLGAADDTDLAYRTGAAVARAVKALGFNWNFAPVLDLNNNPHNPVIAERSFGAEPKRAAELAMSWMAGSHAEGVACCVKHFPGHGDTNVDSHRDLPTVDKPVEELNRLELAPFRIASGAAPAMMTAHIVYPTLDPENPATMSRRILNDLLREEWEYKGIIITDGMDMHAIAGRYGVGNAAVRALTAGADMVMALGTTETQERNAGRHRRRHRWANCRRRRSTPAWRACRRWPGLSMQATLVQGRRGRPRDHGRRLAPQPDRLQLQRAAAPGRRRQSASDRTRRRGQRRRLRSRRAGRRGGRLAAQLYDVELVTFADADSFDWNAAARRPLHHAGLHLAPALRPARARHLAPDLHLALWNPYQALDINAPALMTYGFAQPALNAINAWLSGRTGSHRQRTGSRLQIKEHTGDST